MDENLRKLWAEMDAVINEARSKTKVIGYKIAQYIKEKYWAEIENVTKKYGLIPKIGIEIWGDGLHGYRPVLYLISDEKVGEEVILAIWEELGEWTTEAHLAIVSLTRKDSEILKLEFI